MPAPRAVPAVRRGLRGSPALAPLWLLVGRVGWGAAGLGDFTLSWFWGTWGQPVGQRPPAAPEQVPLVLKGRVADSHPQRGLTSERGWVAAPAHPGRAGWAQGVLGLVAGKEQFGRAKRAGYGAAGWDPCPGQPGAVPKKPSAGIDPPGMEMLEPGSGSWGWKEAGDRTGTGRGQAGMAPSRLAGLGRSRDSSSWCRSRAAAPAPGRGC